MSTEVRVDPALLTNVAARFDSHATSAVDLARRIYAIRADTGRGDSDQMGELVPLDASGLLRAWKDATSIDSGKLITGAAEYASTDQDNSHALQSVGEGLPS